jgi:hypothetical protein
MSQQNNDNGKIMEDTPHMRSVAMMTSQPSVPLMSRSSPFIHQQSPLSLRQQSLDQKHSFKVSAKREQQNQCWNVTSLEPIPPFYKLERTHVYISDVSAEEVAQRIASSIRNEFIAATFDDKQASVQAETKEGVTFAIRLWSHKDQVVAECQRCSGCGFLYIQTVKAVLRAAKTGVVKSPPALPNAFSMPKCLPKQSIEEINTCTVESLEIAKDLLKNDRLDAHILAVESLVQLTEASKCRAFCANFILSSDLLDTLLSLIECSRFDRKALSNEKNISEMEISHFAVMHRHALNILANCLSALEQSGELTSTISKVTDLSSSSLLSTLVTKVASATTMPHEAFQACKCLQKICQGSEQAKQRVLELGASAHLENAQRCRHALLQEASLNLMSEL